MLCIDIFGVCMYLYTVPPSEGLSLQICTKQLLCSCLQLICWITLVNWSMNKTTARVDLTSIYRHPLCGRWIRCWCTDIQSSGLIFAPRTCSLLTRTLLHVWAVNQPKSWLTLHNLRPYPKPKTQDLHLNELPGDAYAHFCLRNMSLVYCILWFYS